MKHIQLQKCFFIEPFYDWVKKSSEREYTIITILLGLPDGETRTHEELAKMFNMTPERVRQVEHKTLHNFIKRLPLEAMRELLTATYMACGCSETYEIDPTNKRLVLKNGRPFGMFKSDGDAQEVCDRLNAEHRKEQNNG